MNRTTLSYLIAGLLSGVLPAAEGSGISPTLMFTDGTTQSFCIDNDTCDGDANPNSVLWTDSIAGFSFVLSGVSSNTTSMLMDFNWAITRLPQMTGNQTIQIAFGDGGFSAAGKLFGAIEGTLPSGWTLTSATAYLDNTIIGSLGPFATSSFAGSFDPPIGPAVFELTEFVDLTTTSQGTTRGSFGLTVPEPGTLALLSLGLAGLAATRRRS